MVFDRARLERRAVFTEKLSDYLPLATDCLSRSKHLFGLVLTSDRSYPRGHPRTLGRVVLALDAYLAAHPEGDALRYRVDWLPVADE